MKPFPDPLQAVLFDLDGTLIDSAPGLYKAMQAYADEQHVKVPSFDLFRQVVSRGAKAMLKTIWQDADEADLVHRSKRFIELYHPFMLNHSRPFAGIEPMLDKLDDAHIAWGIVTNKAGFLAKPFLEHIGWWPRIQAFVAGDTLDVSKPHPHTVLHACEQARVAPGNSIFVGDDARDIQAGNDAGTHSVAVSWGYLNHDDPTTWQADKVCQDVTQLHHYLLQS